jgi:hypothetical protein
MSGLTFQRDPTGHPFRAEADLFDAIDTFAMPSTWPADLDGCMRWLIDAALVAGAAVAANRASFDEAYAAVRRYVDAAEDASRSAVTRTDVLPSLLWFIDETARRVAAWIMLVDFKAETALRKQAVALISAGRGDRAIRAALVDAARKMDPVPPAELLHAAYQGAITECRQNVRWMAQRGSATNE